MLLLARKRDIFKKNTTTRNGAPHATIPSGYSTPRTQYTRGLHGRLRVIVLFSLQKLSRFQIEEQEQNSASPLLFCTIPAFFETKKGVELNASTLSEALDSPQRINANNSRPKRSHSIKQIKICHVAKRCGRPKPVADVSVRLILVAEIVEISDREQEKTLFALKYRLFRCQKMSFGKNVAFSPPFERAFCQGDAPPLLKGLFSSARFCILPANIVRQD